ncbi:MAG TPA: M3 family oligoendopeptidase [Symbiobacteriaceae bacterium]|nr:M3 family oligoendopeptidase [Symbiobacteriaceae bacterium]
MSTALQQRWDLESIFPGGSGSSELRRHLDEVEQGLAALRTQLETAPAAGSGEWLDYWHQVLERIQHLAEAAGQGSSFVGCLASQDVKDREARVLMGRTIDLGAALQAVAAIADDKLVHMADAEFEALLADERIAPLTFNLRERRDLAKKKMNTQRELLATELAIDGYHGWGTLYDTIVGRMAIKLEVDGKEEELSVGQASNKFYEPDRDLRSRLFTKWEEAWSQEAELCAGALNHLSGFRLALYKHRGWDSFLDEPLAINRMSRGTLDAMWEAVSSAKPTLVKFLERKAKLLGYDQMNWYDLYAPLSDASSKMSYEEAADFVVEHFGRFSPQMADFASHAFNHAWIEAENRPGKAPGAYCTGVPLHKESRIFMTFSGDSNSVRTLAHELGHGYHSHVMRNLPPLTQEYAMNVAETASTFAEMLINAAAIAKARSKAEKLALLDSKISDSVSYLMNIHGRFLFETRFYEARKKGMVSIDRLCQLMEEAQKEAYAGALGVYHPHFWAAKLHFYATDVPFYNFPYTFGYLFSAGIYARAKEEGPQFEQKYVDLLCDTGRMTVEDLASRHLGVDLTKPDFWLTGVKMALDDVEEFLALTAE